jgi:hypothetical protein
VEVVGEFFVFVSIVDREFEFSFFGPENDGLPFHAADHVEGGFGLAAQSHLQQVVGDAGLDGFAQLTGYFKEAVGWAQTFDALMGPLVIIILDPKADALAGRLEAFELGPREELLPDAGPEPLDLAEGHGVMRTGLEVGDAVLFKLGLEAGSAAPTGVLASVIRQHLLGRVELAHGGAEDFQDVFGRLAAEQIGPDQETGIIIHEADEIGIASA